MKKFEWDIDAIDLTELQATIETIKLWKYLSEDGERTKEDYFGTEDVSSIVQGGCFFCEYYRVTMQLKKLKKLTKNTNYNFAQLQVQNLCVIHKCPLRSPLLCRFHEESSAFNTWNYSDDVYTREQTAGKILKAALRHYKKLTGEKYYA